MSVTPWFGQPEHPVGTAILLPGRTVGVATPLLHWPAQLLTQRGWAVLGLTWDPDEVERDARSHVLSCAVAALERALADRPVLIVAKSLGTLALPWAVQNGLPGAWLTPVLTDAGVLAAATQAEQPTLLVGGSADALWQPPAAPGPGVTLLELADADHGLQRPGDWRGSLMEQVEVFDRIGELADQVLGDHVSTIATSATDRGSATGATDPPPRVLVVGLDPHRIPGPWDPKPVADRIAAGVARFAEHGVGVEVCLLGLDGSDDLTEVVTRALLAERWECVVIGGGLRQPEDQVELFELVVNLARRHAPQAALAFNRTPSDTYDAAARWIQPDQP